MIKVNRYYLDNPQNIIGTLDFGSAQPHSAPKMIVRRPENMADQLQKAIEESRRAPCCRAWECRSPDLLCQRDRRASRRAGAQERSADDCRRRPACRGQRQKGRKASLKLRFFIHVPSFFFFFIFFALCHGHPCRLVMLVDAERGGRWNLPARKALRGAYDAREGARRTSVLNTWKGSTTHSPPRSPPWRTTTARRPRSWSAALLAPHAR